jgi:hypothetical protein
MVRRQVIETAEQEQSSTVVEPVTTYQTAYVDQGGFVDQQIVQPGRVRNRMRWVPGGCVTDPVTGASAYARGGLAWVQTPGPARVEVMRVWQPNVVATQIPQTNYVQRIVTQKVPVQVCRYVDEEVVRKVPVQVCRIVEEEQVRRVPVQTVRQVVERVQQQTPVQVCRMVEEEVVRRVPVTTCRMVTEERVEQIPVQVCKMVAVEQTIRVPHVVQKQVPVVYTRQVPRVVCTKVPIEPCAPVCCGDAPVMTAPVVATPGVMVTPAVPVVPAQPLGPPIKQSPTPATGNNKGAAPASPSDLNRGGAGSDGASEPPRLPPDEPMPAGPTDTDSNYQPAPEAKDFEDFELKDNDSSA